MRIILACLLTLAASLALPAAGWACGGDEPCRVEGGEYRFLAPPAASSAPPGLLIFVHGHRSSAAEMLGLSRQSLYVKLRKYGLINKDAD